jgi:hypothetical protein
MQNNDTDDLSITMDGPYTFSTALWDLLAYDVTIYNMPFGRGCSVTNGSGFLSGANVANVLIDCAPFPGLLDYNGGGDSYPADGIPDGFIIRDDANGFTGLL